MVTVLALCLALSGTCEPDLVEALQVRASEGPQIAEDAPDGAEPGSRPTTGLESASVDRGLGEMGSEVEQWRPLVAGHFPPDQVDIALCMIKWESGGNPDARNPSSSARGLMQILANLWAPAFGLDEDDMYTPEINLYVARQVWDQSGWSAWSAWNRGVWSNGECK